MTTVPKETSRTYIVILNWNGWKDTINCLESVLLLSEVQFTAVVCDNQSSDGSMEHIEGWAQQLKPHPEDACMCRYTRCSAMDAEVPATSSASVPLVLIDNGANLGFAGGCNVGIRYACNRD